MSCCEGNHDSKYLSGTGCCGTTCTTTKPGYTASEPCIHSCLYQPNVGCFDRADCGGVRPAVTAATGACPGPCQCIEEEAWNQNVPPKPNCEWLSNFSELRRQWSDHGRRENCKCCNCRPSKTAAPCRPCLPSTPRCSTIVALSSNCQDCCNGRLAGGACGPPSSTSYSSSNSRERNAQSSGSCPSPSYNRPPVINCTAYQPPCSSCCPVSSPCSPPYQLPSSCQPCALSPRPIIKKRSCCQCTSSGCLCQPIPRNCNCPPPIHIDARADKECLCNCPSAPECSCPPSERRFPQTKVRCPNARECCPLPRFPLGPKYYCTQCQPCLPPPYNSSTPSIRHTIAPVVKPGRSMSPCFPCSTCQSGSPFITLCRPMPPCAPCCKIVPPCHTPNLYQTPAPSPSQSLAHLSSPRDLSCSTLCKRSGQSPCCCYFSEHEGDKIDRKVDRPSQYRRNPEEKDHANNSDYYYRSLNCISTAISTDNNDFRTIEPCDKHSMKFVSATKDTHGSLSADDAIAEIFNIESVQAVLSLPHTSLISLIDSQAHIGSPIHSDTSIDIESSTVGTFTTANASAHAYANLSEPSNFNSLLLQHPSLIMNVTSSAAHIDAASHRPSLKSVTSVATMLKPVTSNLFPIRSTPILMIIE